MHLFSISLCFIGVLLGSISYGQTTDFQSTPELVMQEIFRAAQEQDYSNLHQLCPSDGSNDGDTQFICDITTGTEIEKEFLSHFKTAKITGEVVYITNSTGAETASVPFWFNHPGGESRSNETMNLIKIDGKWFLASF